MICKMEFPTISYMSKPGKYVPGSNTHLSNCSSQKDAKVRAGRRGFGGGGGIAAAYQPPQSLDLQRGMRAAATRIMPSETIQNCLAVLRKYRPHGVPLDEFEAAYKKVNDRQLDYASYGFASVNDALQSMTAAVEIKRGEFGALTVFTTHSMAQSWENEERQRLEQG